MLPQPQGTAGLTSYLFVYGTLRRGSGHPMGAWLAAHATWCGKGTVAGRLHRVSYYPALTPGEDRVRGDVYALSAAPEAVLAALDAFEDCRGRPEDEYRRGTAAVQMDDGRLLTALLYWYARPANGLEALPGGDWLAGP